MSTQISNFMSLLIITLLSLCGNALYGQLSPNDFVTTWKTDNEGGDSTTEIEIPTIGVGYNYDIDWNGDGTFDEFGVTGNISHDYGTAGTYTVRIRGDFPRLFIGNNESVRAKILSVEQWGNIQWQSMAGAFNGAIFLEINAMDAPDLSNVTNMTAMFQYAYSLNQNINHWNVSNVTDMRFMFNSAINFNQPLNNWDVSNVTDMRFMFHNATSFNQNINEWDVGNVTDMRSMFKVEDLNDPFGLIPIEDTDSAFNQPLNNWNVSNVVNMEGMFFGAINFNQPIGEWNVGNVVTMEEMFYDALQFNQPINNWDVSNVTNMKYMFGSSPGPVFGGGSEHNFNQPLNLWNVTNVTTMFGMFINSENFNQSLNDWDMSNVTDIGAMFFFAEAFDQPLDQWNVKNVEFMDQTFYFSESFNQPLNTWDISSVTTMSGFLLGSKIDADFYDAMLEAWALLELKPNVILSMGQTNFCNSEEARNQIIDSFGWQIIDGGLYCAPYSLPADNFALKIISATCRNKNDGVIQITTNENLNYTASLTGSGLDLRDTFTQDLIFDNLMPGSYQLCFTVENDIDYQKCFEISISEPEAISASSKVNISSKSVTYTFSGSTSYTVLINGNTYQTNEEQATFPLDKIENTVAIYGENGCQGLIEETIVLSELLYAFPNPLVDQDLTVYLGGTNEFDIVRANIFNLNGALLKEDVYEVTNGLLKIDLNGLSKGTYVLSVYHKAKLFTHKILKK